MKRQMVVEPERVWRSSLCCYAANTAQLERKVSKNTRGSQTIRLIAFAFVVFSSHILATFARHIHPTYDRFGVHDYDQLDHTSPRVSPASAVMRRQDYEDGDDDSDSDSADQNAAASYRNQDDQPSNNQNTDGYDDNEPDGPYEETPVESEGQADLERFFDDHLGASDRDGMDKENLPTNRVEITSRPPTTSWSRLAASMNPSHGVIFALPMASVQNPVVYPLPDEKVIVTHQVTRTTTPKQQRRGANNNDERDDDDVDNNVDDHYYGKKQLKRDKNQEDHDHQDKTLIQTDPTIDSHATTHWQLPTQSQEQNDNLKAIGSEVVMTEDDDDDRVFITNATNKPFKIDALGGYDPEADFNDAAKELEVVSNTHHRRHNHRPAASTRRQQPSYKFAVVYHERRPNAASAKATRAHDRQRAYGRQADDESGESQHKPTHEHLRNHIPHDVSFNDPETDHFYEDASETDEVTFGQDDPYQTDLEAEMRKQEYDRVGKFVPEDSERAASSEANKSERNDEPVTRADKKHDKTSSDDDEDLDQDVDNDYKSVAPTQQREVKTSPSEKRRTDNKQEDNDDEGRWIDDGVDDMDIPSQSHQNSVLEKAAQRDALARQLAEEEAKNQQPESGATNEDGEESQRMPNADYMKNDLVDDDSGYRAA